MKHFILFSLLFLSSLIRGQDKTDTGTYFYLDEDSQEPFRPTRNIKGICFIKLNDSFDYYTTPIIIKSIHGKLLVKISYDTVMTVYYKGHTYNGLDSLNPFQPWLWIGNSDYFSIAMECTDTSGNYYKVWLNDTAFAFINKRSRNFQKISLPKLIKDYTSMAFDFNRQTNPLRTSLNDTAAIIPCPANYSQYIIWSGSSLKVKGDWIKVTTAADETGWVRWRKNGTVLIRMYFEC